MMFQYQKLPSDIIKYFAIGLIILGLVVGIPNNKLGIKDALILTIILTLTISIIDLSIRIMNTPNSLPENSVTLSEGFVDVSQQNQMPQPVQEEKPAIPETPSTEPPVVTKPETTPEKPDLYEGQPNAEEKEHNGSRAEDDIITTDMPYTDYHHIPLGDTYKPSDFEYGDSFLPPEKWYPTPPFPPVCVSEKRCPVCPVYTTGTPIDVKEWHQANKIMPPDGINVKYIKDTLNAGR